MSSQDNEDKSNLKQAAFNRRNMLLGGTTLTTAAEVAAGDQLFAQAHSKLRQMARSRTFSSFSATTSGKPISAATRSAWWATRRQTSTASPKKG